MTVDVERHDDAGVPQARLDRLGWQLQATIRLLIDAPRGIKMAQSVQPAVLGPGLTTDHAGSEQGREKVFLHHVGIMLDRADTGREYQVFRTLRTLQLPLPQRVDDHIANRNGPRTGG